MEGEIVVEGEVTFVKGDVTVVEREVIVVEDVVTDVEVKGLLWRVKCDCCGG